MLLKLVSFIIMKRIVTKIIFKNIKNTSGLLKS